MPRADPDDLFAAAPLPVAQLDDAQRLACLRLIRSESVGPVSFRALINRFGGARQAVDALPELVRRGGMSRNPRVFGTDQAEAELEAARRVGAAPLFTIEPGFPRLLAEMEVPPPLVYVKGRIDLLDAPAVAIVGSRDCSAAGEALTRQIAAALGRAGLVIVSGFARGIDGAAHRAALDTGTIAVLAGGIDCIYPPEHATLHATIGERGCLITEQPPGFQPRQKDFPRRNRIIAGLSLGVVVVEAARRSGTLITARLAGELGREVMAVPGHPLDPRAEGTNGLLRDGATMVTQADDVLQALRSIAGGLAAPRAPFEAHSPALPAASLDRSDGDVVPETARARLLAVLSPAPVTVDEAARAAGLSARLAQVALLELNLAGRIEMHGQQMVSLKIAPE